MSRRSVLGALATLATCGLLAAACATKSAPTAGLLIAIDTDLAPGKDFDRLQIEVQPTGGVKPYNTTFTEFGQPGLPLSFPTTLAIVEHSSPSGGADTVLVRASIGIAGGAASPVGSPLVNREAVTTIPRDRVGLLRLHLEWLCVGTADVDATGYVAGLCPEGTTCIGGQCVDWSVGSAALPAYEESAVFGGGTAAGDGACFDTSGCFAAGTLVAPDANCTIPAPATGEPNVAIVTKDGRGICSGGACLVPLDGDAVTGFTREGARLKLPSAVCSTAKTCSGCKDRSLPVGVALTTSCATKLPGLPTCGPWSAVKHPATTGASAPAGVSTTDAGAPSDAGKD